METCWSTNPHGLFFAFPYFCFIYSVVTDKLDKDPHKTKYLLFWGFAYVPILIDLLLMAEWINWLTLVKSFLITEE